MAAVLQSLATVEQMPHHVENSMAIVADQIPSEGNSPITTTTTDINIDVNRPTGPLTRVWEPPPRPKPGRKPATDTPPSKRKAQNRQAQRNFRERRAQKISELESLMEEDRRMSGTTIDKLNAELLHYRKLCDDMTKRLQKVQTDLADEREVRIAAQQEAERVKAILLQEKGAVPLRPKMKFKNHSEGRQSQPTLSKPLPYPGDSHATLCGDKCELGKCACIGETNVVSLSSSQPSKKRILAIPVAVPAIKPFDRIDVSLQPEAEMEIDMTTTRPKATQIKPSSPPFESASLLSTSGARFEDETCGFCNNSSICPCRDYQVTVEQDQDDLMRMQMQQEALDSRTNERVIEGCSGKPGSCSQCQRDPMSKEFCVSFAKQAGPLQAMPSEKRSAMKGCGAKDCCRISSEQSRSHQSTASASTLTSGALVSAQAVSRSEGEANSSSMDCATAYNQLKAHPHFTEAMEKKEEWMRKLKPIPVGNQQACDRWSAETSSATRRFGEPPHLISPSMEGMSAYEIDAASVIATFKHFDTKFGTDSRGDWEKKR